MKCIILLITLFCLTLPAFAESGSFESINATISKIYSSPDASSPVVFEIPIELKILKCTPDKNWYKVKLAFNFLGYHEYVGWATLKPKNHK